MARKYTLIDCCPVPVKLVPVILACKKDSGAVLSSCYRAADARALLARCGKHDQTWLYEHQGTPEQPNPANPPGRSTHELRSDGIAYAAPAGTPLPYWCVGLDVDDAHVRAFCAAARKHGWIATITYPGDPREYHHVNFRKPPIFHSPTIRLHSRGLRVKRLCSRLAFIHSPKDNAPYLPHRYHAYPMFGRTVEEAVKKFQIDHHLRPDGVVGPHTWAQIRVCVRSRKARLKAKKK